MFEKLQDNVRNAVDTIQEKYQGLTDSVDKFNQDMMEIRDLFVSIKNMVLSVFSFIGQETAILLFCTFLFLFIANMIPFLFFDKKARYFIGLCFGVFLSFFFGYTAWALAKYLMIMLFPILLEFLLVKLFHLTWKSVRGVIKKIIGFFKEIFIKAWKKCFGNSGKEADDKKQVQKD